jgi:hypothetical protein
VSCRVVLCGVVSTIQMYKDYSLRLAQIGMYCQEFAIDEAAVERLLAQLVKRTSGDSRFGLVVGWRCQWNLPFTALVVVRDDLPRRMALESAVCGGNMGFQSSAVVDRSWQEDERNRRYTIEFRIENVE